MSKEVQNQNSSDSYKQRYADYQTVYFDSCNAMRDAADQRKQDMMEQQAQLNPPDPNPTNNQKGAAKGVFNRKQRNNKQMQQTNVAGNK